MTVTDEPAKSYSALCGPGRNEAGQTVCICCEEPTPLEELAVSMCWPCVYGNEACRRCVYEGVEVSFFRGSGVSHRLRSPIQRDGDAVTACGVVIPWARLGGGVVGMAEGMRYCRRCWSEDRAP